MAAGQLADLGLGQIAQGENRAAQLLLGQAKQEIGLILRAVSRPLEKPAPGVTIELDFRVVTGGENLRANLLRHYEKLVELQVIVAQAAGDRSSTRQVFPNKRLHHLALKPLLLVHHVIRNAKGLGYPPGIVDIIQGAAAANRGLGHAFPAGQTALVPQLQGEPYDAVALGGQQGGYRGGIDSTRHGDGNGLFSWHTDWLSRPSRLLCAARSGPRAARPFPRFAGSAAPTLPERRSYQSTGWSNGAGLPGGRRAKAPAGGRRLRESKTGQSPDRRPCSAFPS